MLGTPDAIVHNYLLYFHYKVRLYLCEKLFKLTVFLYILCWFYTDINFYNYHGHTIYTFNCYTTTLKLTFNLSGYVRFPSKVLFLAS